MGYALVTTISSSCIPYGLYEMLTFETCPLGITYGKPLIAIVDNNDSTTAQNVTMKEVSKELDMNCKELTNKYATVCMSSRSSYRATSEGNNYSVKKRAASTYI